MILQKNNIIFAGDSFTWGQGLQYYGKFQDIKIMPNNQFIISYLTDEHIEFIKNNRYGKMVSDFFNCEPIIKSENGGSDIEAIDFVYKNINNNTKAVILQTTQPIRSSYEFNHNGNEYQVSGQQIHVENLEIVKIFKNYLIENSISLDDWFLDLKKTIIKKIENLARFLNENKIVFILFSWTNEYDDLLKTNDLLKNNLLSIEYESIKFETIYSLMNAYQELCIVHDHKYFGENPPPDWHMNFECHKIIAKNLIEKLKNKITN